MTLRAMSSVWWPGITPQIKETQDQCKNCMEHAPAQQNPPPTPIPQPDYPFQYVTSDYFQLGGRNYLVITDREIATDGGLTYMAYETQKFLRDYGIRHRVSSIACSTGS